MILHGAPDGYAGAFWVCGRISKGGQPLDVFFVPFCTHKKGPALARAEPSLPPAGRKTPPKAGPRRASPHLFSLYSNFLHFLFKTFS